MPPRSSYRLAMLRVPRRIQAAARRPRNGGRRHDPELQEGAPYHGGRAKSRAQQRPRAPGGRSKPLAARRRASARTLPEPARRPAPCASAPPRRPRACAPRSSPPAGRPAGCPDRGGRASGAAAARSAPASARRGARVRPRRAASREQPRHAQVLRHRHDRQPAALARARSVLLRHAGVARGEAAEHRVVLVQHEFVHQEITAVLAAHHEVVRRAGRGAGSRGRRPSPPSPAPPRRGAACRRARAAPVRRKRLNTSGARASSRSAVEKRPWSVHAAARPPSTPSRSGRPTGGGSQRGTAAQGVQRQHGRVRLLRVARVGVAQPGKRGAHQFHRLVVQRAAVHAVEPVGEVGPHRRVERVPGRTPQRDARTLPGSRPAARRRASRSRRWGGKGAAGGSRRDRRRSPGRIPRSAATRRRRATGCSSPRRSRSGGVPSAIARGRRTARGRRGPRSGWRGRARRRPGRTRCGTERRAGWSG